MSLPQARSQQQSKTSKLTMARHQFRFGLAAPGYTP